VELLAPAGDLEKLQTAVIYGADAVYIGGQAYGLRAQAGNFSFKDMKAGVEFAHQRGAKVYLTVNIFAHNEDIEPLAGYLQEAAATGIDAFIVSDPGVLSVAREVTPNMPLHLSTQANTTNYRSAQFWFASGVERIILARELSLKEIKEIREKTQGTLEAFVHGAMCISYSGRCLISNFMTGRDANRGECAHPCRYQYYLVEEKRPGQYYPVFEDERGTYFFNSDDLCLIEFLPQLMEAGIDSLKIEGRMKSVYYVAVVVSVYRQAIDAYLQDPKTYQFKPEWLEELKRVSHRDYTAGFLLNKPTGKDQNYESSAYNRGYTFVGKVLGYNAAEKKALVEQRNRMFRGEKVEFIGPKGVCFAQEIRSLRDEDGQEIESAPHPQQKVWIEVDYPVEPWYFLRRENRD
jgi:putative protease